MAGHHGDRDGCKEIARLVSESHDHKLSLWDRVQLRLHLAMCLMCRRFSKQLAFVRGVAAVAGHTDPDSPLASGTIVDATLSPEAKNRIRSALQRGPSRS